jgi:hypothetical protein
MLTPLMEKVHNMQEQMGNVNREMETLIEKQSETLKIRNLKTPIMCSSVE